MISVPRGKDDLSLYRGIPSPIALAPWGFGQLLPAVSFSSCEFCNEQRNVLSVSLHPFIFRKRHWSTRYTQFAMILAGVLLGQITYPYAPFGANTARKKPLLSTKAKEVLPAFWGKNRPKYRKNSGRSSRQDCSGHCFCVFGVRNVGYFLGFFARQRVRQNDEWQDLNRNSPILR